MIPLPGMRLGLADLITAGVRALSRYTGTLFAVFVAQSLIAATCMLAVAIVLAQAFAHLPMFDQAVDGDLVALIWCLRTGRASFVAVGGVIVATLLLWQLASWFLVGGLYGVFAERPDDRTATARCFGAAGASTYLAYARLAVCSLPGWAVAATAFGVGLGIAAPRIATALTLPQLAVALAIPLVPTALLLHLFWTVADYARVELTLRGASHAPGVLATYVRSLVFVLRRPLTLGHAALGWLVFITVTLAYATLSEGHPMYGAEGAITLFCVRQGVALLRMAAHVAVMAGQVELGRTRALPPRATEPAGATA